MALCTQLLEFLRRELRTLIQFAKLPLECNFKLMQSCLKVPSHPAVSNTRVITFKAIFANFISKNGILFQFAILGYLARMHIFSHVY